VRRLRYLALLAGALCAIYVGLYPSLLTIGLLISVPLAAVAVAGAVAPDWVARRKWLTTFAMVGGAFVACEAVAMAGYLAIGRRRPVVLVLQLPSPQRVRIVYDVRDGSPRRWLSWERRYSVAPRGVLYTQYGEDNGFYNPKRPHPLRVLIEHGDGKQDTVAGSWSSGGRATSDACSFAYDEFVIGASDVPATRVEASGIPAGWLDSSSTWGVECRNHKLYRAPRANSSSIAPVREVCYFDRAGGMSCRQELGVQ